MATIYLSDLMRNGAIIPHGAESGESFDITGVVNIPAGTDLAANDRLVFCRLPEGTIFQSIWVRFPDLDDGSALTFDVGYDRPVVDPSKAYNATTNPYTDNAIATADPDFFEDAATTAQAGGILTLAYAGFTVTTQAATGVSGDVDVSCTVETGAATATTAGGDVRFTLTVLTNNEQTAGTYAAPYERPYA